MRLVLGRGRGGGRGRGAKYKGLLAAIVARKAMRNRLIRNSRRLKH